MSAPASPAALPARRRRWRWSSWPLTRKLPVLTGSIVVLVVVSSLVLTYGALRSARVEAVHADLQRMARQIADGSVANTRARVALYRAVGAEPAVRALLRRPADEAARRGAESALARLRAAPDSSLPIELWSAGGQRVLRVGAPPTGDSLAARPPELAAAGPAPGAARGGDGVQVGALYATGGGAYFWTVAPIMDGGLQVGAIAQQRRAGGTAQNARTVQALLGNDTELYLYNTTDGFWANYAGEPVTPLAGLDPARGDFRGERRGIGEVVAAQARLPGTPWGLTLEAPVPAVLAEPRAALRRLATLSFLIALAGVLAAWLVSRRLTAPIASLTDAAEAIARGDYSTRVREHRDGAGAGAGDEVARLAASVNRMVGEVELSHRALAHQVSDARAVLIELADTNVDLRRLTEEAGKARDAAEHANRAKSDFLAVMSHELRTPLNAIGGYTEILQLGIYGEVNEQQREALSRVTRSQQLLLSLINDVLNFAKLDAGQVQFNMADVPLGEMLSGVEALVTPQLRARRLVYELAPPPPGLLVRADREKLQQIVLNLLTNAIKFTEPGGRVTLSGVPDGDGRVRVAVADTGVGIEPERLESIFDPFVQVGRAPNRPHEGIGLGLSISRDLASGMGGTLTAESAVGAGSTFTLLLRRSPTA